MSGDKPNRRFSLDSLGYSPDYGVMVTRAKSSKVRRASEGAKVRSLDETELLELNRNLLRTNSRNSTIEEEGGDREVDGQSNRNSFKNHKKTFTKQFPEISEAEDLVHAFTCALQKEVLYHGKMYVSEHHVCFHSSVLLKETKVVIHVSTIQEVKKKNTARVLPNAIAIITNSGEKYLFVSVRNRHSCFEVLQSACPHLQVGDLSEVLDYDAVSANGSPHMSSAENGHEPDTISSHSSQDEFADLWGLSFTEEGYKLDGKLSFTPSNMPLGQAKSSSTPRSSTSREGHSTEEEDAAVSWVTMVTEKIKSVLSMSNTTSYNKLLIVYLILFVLLLLSSGYIGLRIVALEEQLNTLGAMTEFSLQTDLKET